MDELRFDNTINIESLVAAIGVVGAATGYIFKLIKDWRYQYKDNKYHGTNLIILDLLETHFYDGLSENKLWELYNDSATKGKRGIYKAWKPSSLRRIGFEKQLRHLQDRFLIRLTGKDHYHIAFHDKRDWLEQERQDRIEYSRQSILEKIGETDLCEILLKHLKEDDISSYKRTDTLMTLLKLGNQNAVEILINDLQSSEKDKIDAAVEIINRMNNRYM
jgi:hypothetical protein